MKSTKLILAGLSVGSLLQTIIPEINFMYISIIVYVLISELPNLFNKKNDSRY